MSQTELDHLLDQLYAEDARTRRKAAQRLGELARPEAIAELVNVYLKDSDSSVRKTAGDSLRIFRQIEQKMTGAASGEQQSSLDMGSLLSRARIVLAITLVITAMVNVIFIGMSLGKAFQSAPTPTVVQTVPTARDTLVSAFTSRITQARAEATQLRTVFSTMQGMGLSGVKQELCQQLQASTLTQGELSPIDSATYPDLRSVNDIINIPTLKVVTLRNDYSLLCGIKDATQFNNQMTQFGGAAALVATADEVTNKDLLNADGALKRAIDKPAPTVGPTSKPASTLTPTVPTRTPTKQGTAVSTSAATVEATTKPEATLAPTQLTTYNLNGLVLDSLTSYKYHADVSTIGTFPNGKTFHGSLNYDVQRQKEPVAAQYEVRLNEGNPALTFFKPYLSSLYVAGDSTYVLVNNVLYEYGNVVDPKSLTKCRALKVTGDNTAILQDISLGDMGSIALTKTADADSVVNGSTVSHFRGTRHTGNNNELVQNLDVYLSVDKHIPVEISMTLSLDPVSAQDPKVVADFGLKDYTQTFTYDLTSQNVVLDIAKPKLCELTVAK